MGFETPIPTHIATVSETVIVIVYQTLAHICSV